MSAPVIAAISVQPQPVLPGGAFVVTIDAHDPDERAGILTGIVSDAAGHVSRATVAVTISDPLTYQLLDEAGAGFTITPRVGQPGVFDCLAPA